MKSRNPSGGHLEPTGGESEQNVRFIQLLSVLTRVCRAKWIRSKGNPGFVFCLVDDEDLIVFETMGGEAGDEHVPPDADLAGIVAHHSNTTYLWLPLLPGWGSLLKLLRSSRADDCLWHVCKRLAYEAPVKALEKRLAQE